MIILISNINCSICKYKPIILINKNNNKYYYNHIIEVLVVIHYS